MLLLTGATGVLGHGVVRRLTARGIPVRCLVRDPRRLGPERVRVQLAIGDLADPASWRNALRGVDTLRDAGIDAGPCAGAGVAGIVAVVGYEAEAARLGIGETDEVLLFATEGAAAVTSPHGAGGARLLA